MQLESSSRNYSHGLCTEQSCTEIRCMDAFQFCQIIKYLSMIPQKCILDFYHAHLLCKSPLSSPFTLDATPDSPLMFSLAGIVK